MAVTLVTLSCKFGQQCEALPLSRPQSAANLTCLFIYKQLLLDMNLNVGLVASSLQNSQREFDSGIEQFVFPWNGYDIA